MKQYRNAAGAPSKQREGEKMDKHGGARRELHCIASIKTRRGLKKQKGKERRAIMQNRAQGQHEERASRRKRPADWGRKRRASRGGA
jgi:hypothetical protein